MLAFYTQGGHMRLLTSHKSHLVHCFWECFLRCFYISCLDKQQGKSHFPVHYIPFICGYIKFNFVSFVERCSWINNVIGRKLEIEDLLKGKKRVETTNTRLLYKVENDVSAIQCHSNHIKQKNKVSLVYLPHSAHSSPVLNQGQAHFVAE